MDKLIRELRLKIESCGNKTKESRARKGAYTDALIMANKSLTSQCMYCEKEIKQNEAIVICEDCCK